MHTNKCKGFGFAMFKRKEDADKSLVVLKTLGFEACYARKSATPKLDQNLFEKMSKLKDTDSSNVYLANLPPYFNEDDLRAMVPDEYIKDVVSIKVLLTGSKKCTGVGFIKMVDRKVAQRVITLLDGVVLQGSKFPVEARFANSEAQNEE